MKKNKSFKRWSIIAVCCIMLFGGTPIYAYAAAGNDVEVPMTNGDFEAPIEIPGWTIESGEAAIVQTNREANNINSLNLRAGNQAVEVSTVTSSVYEHGTFQVNAKLYWESVSGGELNYSIDYYDSSNNNLSSHSNFWSAPKNVTGAWLDLSGTSTAPAGTSYAKLTFSSAADSSFSAYIDDVTIINKNDQANTVTVTNGGFEQNAKIAGWSKVGTGTLELSKQQFKSGSNSLYLHDNSSSSLRADSDLIDVTPGNQLTINWEMYPVALSASIVQQIYYYDSSNNPVGTAQQTFYVITPSGDRIVVTPNQWNSLSVETTVPDKAVKMKIAFNSGGSSTSEVYLDDVVITNKVEENHTSSLLINPGFEAALVEGEVPGWTVNPSMVNNGTMALSTNIKRTGNNSLYFYDSVTGDNGTGKRYQVFSNSFEVTPGDGISAEAYIYKLQQTHGIVLEFNFYNASGAVVSTKQQNNGAATVPAEKWHKIVIPEMLVPDNAVTANLAIYSGDLAITEIYVDDTAVTIVPANTEPVDYPAEIPNAGFEEELVQGAIPGWSLASGTAGIFQVSAEIYHEGSKSLYFHDNSTDIGLRVISDPIAAKPGDSIIFKSSVYVISQTHNIVPEIYYYNDKNQQVGVEQVTFSGVSLGTKKWTTMRLASNVPAGAAYAKVALYSGAPSITEAYFDSLSLTVVQPEEPLNRQYGEPAALGDMVYANLGQAGAVQTNANGDNEVYFVTNGKPGSFFALDAETGVIKHQEVIPNTVATWAMAIGEDKNVYFAGTEDGILYRYLPEAKKIEKLGYNTTDNWTWDIEIIGDKLYGGTYNSQTDGKLFEYDITNGTFRNYGVVDEGQQYVRGIAVDEEYVYAGLGTKSIKLVKVKRDTGEKTEIHIPGYSGTTGTIADVFIIGKKLFVSVSTINMVVIDMETGLVDSEFQYSNMISEPSPKDANIIYYKYLSQFYKYDMAAKQSTEIVLPYPLPDTTRVKDLSWIKLNSGEKAGQTVLGMITQYGEFALIDPDDQWVSFVDLEVDAMPVNIQSLKAGFDGRLYLGGYQRGMSVYNPFTDNLDVTMTTFAQPEGIGFLNDKVYYGTYVSAIMYSYDITKDAVMNENPKFEFDIAHQDRPFALTSGDNKLFVGTVPDYGFLGGSLVIFDEAKNQWSQYDNVVPNQSIIGLAYKDGLLYGSTTVWGGLGIEPSEPEAKMFVWDVERGEKIDEFALNDLEIDEAPRMIGSIAFGPDGLLWGIVDGTIFAMDTDTKQIVKSKMIRPSMYNSSKWLPYEIEWGPDGTIYTTLARKVYAVDPESMKYKLVVDGFVNSMTIGIDGSIYYAPNAGTSLSRIAVPETDATLSALQAGGSGVEGFSPGVLSYQVPIIDGAEITAVTAQPGASVDIEGDRVIGGQSLIHVTAADGKSKLQYVINWTEKPVGPVEPTPTPTPTPTPAPSSTPSPTANNTQAVTAAELAASSSVQVKPGIHKVELPIDAAAIVNGNPVVLQNGSIAIELAPAVLEQLQQLAADSGLGNAVIGVAFELADEQSENSMVSKAANRYGAAVTAASGIYNINLSVSANGAAASPAGFAEPVELSFPIPAGVDERLLGIFAVASDGSLSYAGGKVKDGVISAQIEKAGQYVVLEFNKSFADVADSHWAARVIKEMAAKLIANGVNETDFAPEREITRAEFVALIVRAAGLQASGETVQFADVKPGDWYAQAVAAAYEAGIINGKGAGMFAPSQTITREEMAAIAIRALAFQQGGEAVEAGGDLFADHGSISGWAQEAVSQAYKLGLVSGRGGNQFVPKDELTRAEAIQVIYNLLHL